MTSVISTNRHQFHRHTKRLVTVQCSVGDAVPSEESGQAAVRFESVQNGVHLFQESDVGVPKRDGDVVIQIRVEDEKSTMRSPLSGCVFRYQPNIQSDTTPADISFLATAARISSWVGYSVRTAMCFAFKK